MKGTCFTVKEFIVTNKLPKAEIGTLAKSLSVETIGPLLITSQETYVNR